MACELCENTGGELVWENDLCRVVHVNELDYPGFCRVIVQRHVKEMADLPEEERLAVMHVVFAVEQTLIKLMHPLKINLASLGNLVPHVHWHVIPRFADDAHFPQPIWAARTRSGSRRAAPDLATLRNTLDEFV